MKKAVIYTRVSTDEQLSGYSPEDQLDKLLTYCANKNIEVVKHYQDDYTGTKMDRPKLNELRSFVKKNRHEIDHIFFVKWDRFSRVVVHAYLLLEELRNLDIDVQGIEQPLDYDVPESKIMLAIYVATPEVDNHRRTLNTVNGMRRAIRMGRYLGCAPLGYINLRDSEKKAIILPSPDALLVTEAFNLFSTGLYSIEEVRQAIKEKGLKISRSVFHRMLINPVYKGVVTLKPYKKESGEQIRGIHPPLVDEITFERVQDIVYGRRPKNTKKTKDENLPLRGFLTCPACNNNLTGSASRGRWGGRFYYYHCRGTCKTRYKANDINNKIVEVLKVIKPQNSSVVKLFEKVLSEELVDLQAEIYMKIKKVDEEIARYKTRIKNVAEDYADRKTTPEDYKSLKADYEKAISDLMKSKYTLTLETDVNNEYKESVELLTNIDKHYMDGDLKIKQEIVGSIFPEKLIFENIDCRTPVIQEGVWLILNGGKPFEKQKAGENCFLTISSRLVAKPGVEPGTSGL